MPKKPQPDQYAKALWEAINAIPEEQRPYLLNFVTKNAYRPLDEMLERMAQDRAEREEAEKIQKHRDEKVLRDAIEAAKRLGAEVMITGVAADASTETATVKE